MKVDIELAHEDAKKPEYQYIGEDIGLDLFSVEKGIIASGKWKVFDTGIKIAIPEGYGGFINPRSGLALDYGVTVLNSDGVIDPGYRGTIGVILINHSKSEYWVAKGERIAQLIIHKTPKIELNIVDNLDDTERGEGGFGHSGSQ